ncbi:MAG: hypothetical protein KBD60_03955 [Sterolibacterium sp.]|jgi:hypothetical protein|nr:hypothetical protein [Sterolibacterium sp.]
MKYDVQFNVDALFVLWVGLPGRLFPCRVLMTMESDAIGISNIFVVAIQCKGFAQPVG